MLFFKCSYLKISELAACRGRSHRMGTRSGRLRAQAVEAGAGRGPVSVARGQSFLKRTEFDPYLYMSHIE